MTSGNRALRWLRVSGDSQSEEDQEPEINDYCDERDYEYKSRPPIVVHGKSAYKGAQDPYWQKVVNAFRNHEIDVIVLWMVDRLDRRNILRAVPMVNAVLDVGGRIEFSEQPECNLDAKDPDLSDKVEAFAKRCADAHRESKIKSKRVKKTFNRIDANGAIRNAAGYGHQITGEKYNKRFELDNAEAGVIRLAVSRYLSGQSLMHVCRWLTAEGHHGRNGAKWTPKTLGHILRDERLIGRFHQGDITTRVPAIITVRQFNAVKARLDAKAYRKGVRTRTDTALLTSILRCGKCDGPMYKIKSGGRVSRNGHTGKPSPSGKISAVEYCYYCRSGKGCKMLIPLIDADRELAAHLVAAGRKVKQKVTTLGHNYDDEIDQLALDVQRLNPLADDYRRLVDEKLAEIDRLRLLPAVGDRTETREIDIAELAPRWKAMTTAERRALLLEVGFTVWATKDASGRFTLRSESPLSRQILKKS